MSSVAPTRLTGGCQCGAVRYALRTPSTHASVCYCRMCQKASGGPYMAFARVRSSDIEWTHGAPALFNSSSVVERGFCRDCGTPLTYRFIEGPYISVTIGSLDDPESAKPEVQYCIDGELSWVASLRTLPSRRLEDLFSPDLMARLVSNQHPDHES